MVSFPDPIKIITNIETDKDPPYLFDVFIDIWKMKQIGVGALSMQLLQDGTETGEFILSKKRHGEKESPFARQPLIYGDLIEFRETMLKTHKQFELIHKECDRIEKTDWIGVKGIEETIPYFLIAFRLSKMAQTIIDLSDKKVPLWDGRSRVDFFSVSSGYGAIMKGELVSVGIDGLISKTSSYGPEAALGIAEENIREGELVSIAIPPSPSEKLRFRRAGGLPDPVINWENANPFVHPKWNPTGGIPIEKEPEKKEPKGIVLTSLESIREKLGRTE